MKILKYLLSIPKTIIFNLKVFELKTALKLPVLVAYNVKLDQYHRNCIEIKSDISRFMIKININDGSKGINHNLSGKGFISIGEKGKMIFNGKADFSKGVSFRIGNGELEFGNNFSCNKNCFFASSSKVSIGNDVLLGWSVSIRDSDGHKVFSKDGVKSDTSIKPVSIGDHVWIAANVDILKGVQIQNDSVVGYRSCVTKSFRESNCVIAGVPAKVIKNNIEWQL